MSSFILTYDHRANKKYDTNAEAIDVRYDSASLALGKRLVNTRACTECHGKDLGGTTLIEDGLIGTFVTKNITKGKGGLPARFCNIRLGTGHEARREERWKATLPDALP